MPACRLELFGPFRLTTAGGQAIRVPSAKGRALLAVLALSTRGERSRGFLQDLLWSRVGREEAQSSLRRELSNLRSILDRDAPGLIEADAICVRLRPDRCIVEPPAPGAGPLLEGLDLRGEEPFEDWLREARSNPGAASSQSATRPATSARTDAHGLSVGILPVVAESGRWLEASEGDRLADAIARALQQTGWIQVIDYRPAVANASSAEFGVSALLSLRVREGADVLHLSLTASEVGSGAFLCAKRETVPCSSSADDPDAMAGAVFVHETVEELLRALAGRSHLRDDPKHLAGRHVLSAIDRMFSLTAPDLDEAENHLAAASSLTKHSSILAWRAYLSVFRGDAAQPLDHPSLCAQAEDFCEQALALNPYNGFALALVAHVHSFLLRDFERAATYLERAHALKTEHVMLHDADALFAFYNDDLPRARASIRRAELLGRHLPYRFCFASAACMIEALAGDLPAAIRHGERALSLQPRRAEPYAPTLRYLGSTYSAIGDLEAAERLYVRLKKVDPHASSVNVTTRTYPTPSSRAAAFIQQGLRRLDM